MNQLRQHLAESILQLRRKRGITQAKLAALAEVPRSTISHMESGSGNPTLTNLSKVAAALQVSVEELLAAPRPECKLIKNSDLARIKKGQVILIRLLPDPIPGMLIDRMFARISGLYV